VKRPKIIFFFLSLFLCFCAAAAAQDFNDRRIQDELKRERQQMQQTQDILKQSKIAEKMLSDKLKEDERLLKEDLRQRQEAAQQYRLAQRQQERLFMQEVMKNNLGRVLNLLLLLIAAILFYILFTTLISERRAKAAVAEKEAQNALAMVNTWIFTDDDFNKIVDKLRFVAEAQKLDIDSSGFKVQFIRDLAVSEILYQIALEQVIYDESAYSQAWNGYVTYLTDLRNNLAGLAGHLERYGQVVAGAKENSGRFLSYYPDFLGMLAVLDARDSAKNFAFASRYLLLKKMLEGAAAEGSDAQKSLDGLIAKFVARSKIAINVASPEAKVSS
jgi:hypothetical protein